MRPESRDSIIAPLTSLRFFAAFAVVVFHSGASYLRNLRILPEPILNVIFNGYVGVTFFFVLSGFILQIVYSGHLVERGSIRKFFEARVARIYPVYLLALILLFPNEGRLGFMAIPQFLLLQSWPLSGHPEFYNWNLPAWTLSAELFFYLLFPFFSRLAERVGLAAKLVVLAICGLFVLITASPYVTTNVQVPQQWMAYVPVPLLRLPEFVMGVMIGQLAAQRGTKKGSPVWPGVLIIAIIVTLATTRDPHVAAVVTLLSAALIYALATSPPTRLYSVLSWRPLVLLGASSYSLYLLHAPLHALLGLIAGPTKLVFVLQYPLLIGVALLVFRFYEEPAREALRAHWRMQRSAIARA